MKHCIKKKNPHAIEIENFPAYFFFDRWTISLKYKACQKAHLLHISNFSGLSGRARKHPRSTGKPREVAIDL